MRYIYPLLLSIIFHQSLFSKTTEMNSWRNEFLNAVRSESLSPNLMVRNLALFSVSVHDALNSLEKKYFPFSNFHNHNLREWDLNAVIAGCGKTIGNYLHPARLENFNKLASFAKDSKSSKLKNSYLFGTSVARFFLNNRKNDGASTTITYIPRDSVGIWRRTPKAFRPPEQPHWRHVRLFSSQSIEKFLPPPPPKITSSEYIDALKQVKIIGGKNSQLRTKKETFIAKFWKDFSYSQTPPGHWNEIAFSVSKARKMSILDEAKLFALLNLALADTGITAWECKYRYHFWRPVHAIRNADQIPETQKYVNKLWIPLLESPSHPEYVSAHSFFSGTASLILAKICGSDNFKIRVKSDQFPSETRVFDSFSSCAQEIGKSRLLGGIHFKFSNEIALEYGNKIGNFYYNNYLLKVDRN